ncbi:MAG: hypothetical protein JWQ20_1396 [Conexibacter sp.]|nr:hypothetical protein [Conexibacter sp.]
MLVDRVGALAAELRARGARIGIGEVLVAHRALAAIDASVRVEAFDALRIVLCSTREDLEVFPEAFAAVFGAPDDAEPGAASLQDARQAAPQPDEPARTHWAALPAGASVPEEEPADPAPAAWSDAEILRRKDFADYTEADHLAARQLLERLAARVPQRRSRRTRPVPGRGPVYDLRASMLASVRHGTEMVQPCWRDHRRQPRRLVLVCDVSGSMAPYARVLLQYVQAIVATQARAEAFVFGTRLTRLTAELAGRDPDAAIARATAQAADWSGGTRIGAALAQLNREHGRRVGRGALVVVLSDGWDRGDPAELGAELARLGRCAHRVVWLSPPAADPQYEPLTRGMRAALPHVDRLMPGNSISSLEDLADLFAAGVPAAGFPGAPRRTTS